MAWMMTPRMASKLMDLKIALMIDPKTMLSLTTMIGSNNNACNNDYSDNNNGSDKDYGSNKNDGSNDYGF